MVSTIMEAIVKCKSNQICIKNAFHVPKLHTYLLLVSELVLHRLKVHFSLNECIVKFYNGNAIVIAPEGQFVLNNLCKDARRRCDQPHAMEWSIRAMNPLKFTFETPFFAIIALKFSQKRVCDVSWDCISLHTMVNTLRYWLSYTW